MSLPLLSVIIPTFNHGHYVLQAVESALAQTYKPIEVIIVDDGSTDDTATLLQKYGQKIHYIRQENQGLSAARNTGMRVAQGEYYALLDSDDQFHPRKLERQFTCLQKHSEVALLGTAQFSDEPIRWSACGEELPVTNISLAAMAMKPRFAPSSVLAHRRCFQVAGEFDTTLRSVEDRDMWLRIATHFPMARLDLPLTWYRISPGSMSTHPERMEHYELLVLQKAFKLPELQNEKQVQRIAWSHCYRSSAYTFYAAGRYREAINRLRLSIQHWPYAYRPADEVPSWYRSRLFLGIMKRWLFSSTKA